MRIYKTLTEHMNGRIRDESYPSGFKRRVGSERTQLDPTARRANDRYAVTVIYDEAPAPRTFLYGQADPDTDYGFKQGGTVHLITEDCPAVAPFTADEVEYVVRRLVRRYETALFVLNGNYSQGYEKTAAECYRDACEAHTRVKQLVGVDLDETNVAFPYRLYQPNRTEALEADPTITLTPSAPALI